MISPSVINDKKIFVISIQRTGTTSTGQFLSELGYKVAHNGVSRKNKWGIKAFLGKLDEIFSSKDFNNYNAFEDGPWFFPDLYKTLYQTFPNALFVHFERDPEEWFKSLYNHSNGKSLGLKNIHSWIYDINDKLNIKSDNHFYDLNGMGQHYIKKYISLNKEIKDFFSNQSDHRYFYSDLDSEYKWDKLAKFLGKKNTVGNIHVNRSISSVHKNE